MNRKKSKRALALFIALAVMFTMIPENTHAALTSGKSCKAVFKYLGKGADGKYYYKSGSDVRLSRITAASGGKEYTGYCLNPGKNFIDGHSYTSKTYSSAPAWKALSASEQKTLSLVMLYGYPCGRAVPHGNSNDWYAATQALVWEVVKGYEKVDAGGNWISKSNKYDNMIQSDPFRKYGYENYIWMRERISSHVRGPSFAGKTSGAAKTHTMKYSYKTKKFSIALSDANRGNNYKASSLTSGLSMSRSGYKYTFTAAKAGTYKGVFKNDITSAGQAMLVLQPSSTSDQAVILGATDTTNFYADFKTEATGKVQIKKTSDDGKVSGFTFNVKCEENGYNADHKTGSEGTVTQSLYPGTYTITEKLTDAQKKAGYVAPKPKTVTVTSGKTATVTMHNDRDKGTVKIVKTSDDGKVDGFTFNVKCAANSYDKDHKTGSTGTITQNVYPGTYTITEKLTDAQKKAGYVAPKAVTVTVTAGKTATVTMHNKREPVPVKIIKTSDTGVVAGFPFIIKSSDGKYNKRFVTTETMINGEKVGIIEEKLYPGTYTITEDLTRTQLEQGYQNAAPVTKAITAGQTVSIPVHNVFEPPKPGLRIFKDTSDDGPVEGFKFKTVGIHFNSKSITSDEILSLSAPQVTGMEDYDIGQWSPADGTADVIDEINRDAKEGKTGEYEVRYTAEATLKDTGDTDDGQNGEEGQTPGDGEQPPDEGGEEPGEPKPEAITLEIPVKVILADVSKTTAAAEERTDETGYVIYKDVTAAIAATRFEDVKATDEDGKIEYRELEKGTYTVTEVMTDVQELRYEEPQSQTVVLDEEDKSLSFFFENIAKQTPVRIKKSCSDGNIEGIEFTITGRTAWDEEIEPIVEETDKDGYIEPLLYGGTYTIEETGLDPKLYVKQEPVTVTITGEEEEPVEISFNNIPYVDVSISKKDLTTDEELPGATLQVLDGQTEEVVDEWVSTGIAHVTEGLTEGKDYILRETDPPKGYGIAEDIRFTAGNKMTVEMKDAPTTASIQKVDNHGEPLAGATLQVLTADTEEVVAEWISTDEAHETDGLIYQKEYILRELQAPEGYVPAEDIRFTAQQTNIIEMVNEPNTVEVAKKDAATGEYLPGASLQLIDAETEEVFTEWTSGAEPFTAEGLTPKKEYILREIEAPYGYRTADDIRFIAGEQETVEMTDELTRLLITKIDEETGYFLPGAEFEIRAPEDDALICRFEITEENGQVTAKISEAIDVISTGREEASMDEVSHVEWMSINRPSEEQLAMLQEAFSNAQPSQFAQIRGLDEHEEYILRETKTPEGYTPMEDKRFIFTDGMLICAENSRPRISTQARDAENGTQISRADRSVTLVDTVMYENLAKNRQYTLMAILMREDGTQVLDAEGKAVSSVLTFTPEKAKGTVDITLPAFDGMEMDGQDVVIFEYLYYDDKEVANHADIKSKEQTVTLKEEIGYVDMSDRDELLRSLGITATGDNSGKIILACVVLMILSAAAALASRRRKKEKNEQ